MSDRCTLDFRHIDNNRWPGTGPVYDFLRFNRVVADGICVDISSAQAHPRLARQRGYEIRDKLHNLCELVISHAEFMQPDFKNCRVMKMFCLINISYGLMLGLNPEQITFPGGLYGERCEHRAMRDYMRPKLNHEIAQGPAITQRLSALARKNSSLHGMYCLDITKMTDIRNDVQILLNEDQTGRYFGVQCVLKDIITEKVSALLKSTRETTWLPEATVVANGSSDAEWKPAVTV
jgi:hypothetical protein